MLEVMASKPYKINFVNDFCHQSLVLAVPEYVSKVVIITDNVVAPLYLSKLLKFLPYQTTSITIPHGEISKSRQMKAFLEDQLFAQGCGRDTCLISLGGGVVSDLVGFVAATFCRGVPCIYIPTSLLAMVDASIGGKTGINTSYGKNLIGTFTQPIAVIIAIDVLDTLPEAEYISAFAEVVKHSLIYDTEFFYYLAKNTEKIKSRNKSFLLKAIKRSCEIKAEIVACDETEKGLREILNFGHTYAHALEKITGYSLTHGFAVSIGLAWESKLASSLGYLPYEELENILNVLGSIGLPTENTDSISSVVLKDALLSDKKNKNGKVHFVLLEKIGKVFVGEYGEFSHPVSIKDMNEAK